MQINPNSPVPGAASLPPVASPATAAAPAQAPKIDLHDSAELERALNDVPEVRPEKVAAAKALIETPGYPPDATLGKVASLLADHLDAEGTGV